MTARPSPRRRAAFATCEGLTELDGDDGPLREALARRDVDVIPAVWTDPSLPWADFDVIVLRSCWDYDERPDAFRRWIDGLGALAVPVLNPPSLLAWNLDKTHLRELEAAGIPVVPTVWRRRGSPGTLTELLRERDWSEAVVKPVVSLSAKGTWRTSAERALDDEARFSGQLTGVDLMIQRFMPSVLDSGEWSFVFFDGELSHTVVKHPAVGDFRVQGEYGGQRRRVEAPPELVEQAAAVLAATPGSPIYARVDGVLESGRFVLMEIELIDPQLYFREAPERADVLADRIVARLR